MISETLIAAPGGIAGLLDPGFQPLSVFMDGYDRSTGAMPNRVPLVIALERESGRVSRYATWVRPKTDPETCCYVERLVKFLLWSRGGFRLFIAAPPEIARHIGVCYSPYGPRGFDVQFIRSVYGRSLEIIPVSSPDEVPEENESGGSIGGYLDGCRLGLDLGASELKVAAMQDGEASFSTSVPWNPQDVTTPLQFHDALDKVLKLAAPHLPRIDAIGFSTAGLVVDNRLVISSLLRNVSARDLAEAGEMFLQLGREWQVPVEVANDGEVAALAGAIGVGEASVLGIALGSSEAVGFLDEDRHMTGWWNELAFAPLDLNPKAPCDEWSGDQGVGVSYLSQQAVGRLSVRAGLEIDPRASTQDRLHAVRQLFAVGDPGAIAIYETVGLYLGYAVPLYARFYDFQNALIFGGVTSEGCGEVILKKAEQVLTTRFPELASQIQLRMPSRADRRVGQAVAAASLPQLATVCA